MSPKKRKTIASHSHMKHKISTADCNYVISVNAEKVGQAHELMGKIISREKPQRKRMLLPLIPRRPSKRSKKAHRLLWRKLNEVTKLWLR